MDLHLSPRILVAESRPAEQENVRACLEKFGCEVAIADSGENAVEKSSANDFDLVFMNCELPTINGFEASETIRDKEVQRNRHVPIVAVTEDIESADRELFLEAGMDDYICKPYSSDQVWCALNRWLPPTFPRLEYAE